MRKGFTGDIYNGVEVFERNEYESYYHNLTEVERLGDCLGLDFGSVPLSAAISKAEDVNRNLVYNVISKELDERLRNYESVEQMWIPYRCGYVHKITGEYVRGDKPNYDSFPCWCKPFRINKEKLMKSIADNTNASTFMLGLLALFGR